MKKQITAVSTIQIVFSSIWLVAAVITFIGISIAIGVVGDPFVERILGIVRLTFPVFIGIISLLGLIGGIALLSYKNWARIMTIIVSGIGCFFIPIGTLIGAYSIWVLMQDDTVKLFNT